MKRIQQRFLLGLFILGLMACTPTDSVAPTAEVSLTEMAVVLPTASNTAVSLTNTPRPTNPPPATSTPIPTSTVTPTITPTFTPSATATSTPAPICTDRVPSQDDLLPIVSYEYGLSRDYEPDDMVSINDYFPFEVTKGYPNEIRAVVLEPLQKLIAAMQAAGLQPQIISGYRSFYSQNVAFQKWLEKEPERATQLSARPGHSEHQLGTTVDFGSPLLYQYVEGADETLEFHTYFYKTPEGQWLLENAHRYGFTLSYPREAQEMTGFYYEPWHYRYVGVEMATYLKDNNLYLTQYLLSINPEPCED